MTLPLTQPQQDALKLLEVHGPGVFYQIPAQTWASLRSKELVKFRNLGRGRFKAELTPWGKSILSWTKGANFQPYKPLLREIASHKRDGKNWRKK